MNEQILVFRPGALGDTILTVDALAALRVRFPSSAIELIGNADAASPLLRSGLLDSVCSFDAAAVGALFQSQPRVSGRWEGADVVISWMHATQVAEAFQTRTAARIVFAPPETDGPPMHVADHLVQTLAPLGVTSAGTEQLALLSTVNEGPFNVSSPQASRRRSLRNAVIHPGSGSVRKNWPAERYAKLGERLSSHGWHVTWTAGPADEAVIEEVSKRTAGPIRILRPRSALNLASIIAAADLYLGNDSGVTHLSARLGVPTIAIFGPTSPRVWGPRGPRVQIISTEGGGWRSVDDVWGPVVKFGD
ncbi:MAG: rfaC 1 [Chloroflexi bacterium]|nr:rfaC 1 [Chloroflexota bacterium]